MKMQIVWYKIEHPSRLLVRMRGVCFIKYFSHNKTVKVLCIYSVV
jgi:hypothetical protein